MPASALWSLLISGLFGELYIGFLWIFYLRIMWRYPNIGSFDAYIELLDREELVF